MSFVRVTIVAVAVQIHSRIDLATTRLSNLSCFKSLAEETFWGGVIFTLFTMCEATWQHHLSGLRAISQLKTGCENMNEFPFSLP